MPRKRLKKYYKISLPDLEDIIWSAIVKVQDDKAFSKTWLKTRLLEKQGKTLRPHTRSIKNRLTRRKRKC